MLSPFHDGALRAILAGLQDLDEMLCGENTCERVCPRSLDRECPDSTTFPYPSHWRGMAYSCKTHPQDESCLSLWQEKKLAEDAVCRMCQPHIIIQKVSAMLTSISPTASAHEAAVQKSLDELQKDIEKRRNKP